MFRVAQVERQVPIWKAREKSSIDLIMAAPSWLSLLSTLPADAVPQRKPVASAEQLAAGTAGLIAGWQSVTVNLSAPDHGLRHVLITLDEHGRLLSAGDHVMFVGVITAEGHVTLSDHHSVGGRFEQDGSFRGTYSTTRLESRGDAEESVPTASSQRPPTDEEIAALKRIVDDVLRRVSR